ncbi:dipeptidase [Portibacter lacus]|uniref:Peptidase n=1 Tax=Portibacter lacus TaxID=1099794 RepID=A0AA37SSH0_9BACT|nr:membrane dipeptidase [Portibacter lacus]GLR17328.1 peptidase [Portibacter lacus]
MEKPFIIDAHLDLSMNAMQWNRDLTQPVKGIRQRELGMTDKPDRSNNMVSLPQMREGNVGFCFATLIARYAKPDHPLGGWNSPAQAWATVQGQLAWYQQMDREDEMWMVEDLESFDDFLGQWDHHGIGYLLSLEGADSIVSFDHLYLLYADGLRAIGPAHYGPGTYAHGTNSEGGIGDKGRELLAKMEDLEMALDVTHLCDTSFWEALKHFKGEVWASHSNCRSIVDHNRQFSDDQIKALIERDAVIGMPLDAWMMIPNWERGISSPDQKNVTLYDMVNHIDHICQIAGNTDHIGLGTDLDGGFGTEQSPHDLDTIADLQNIPSILTNRGYTEEDTLKFLNGNWTKKLRTVLQ